MADVAENGGAAVSAVRLRSTEAGSGSVGMSVMPLFVAYDDEISALETHSVTNADNHE